MASGLVSSLLSSASSLLAILRRPPSSAYPRSDHRTVSVDLQRLERLLSRIQATLDDAEEQEVQDNYVKLWLTELKDLARDADDLLDDYRYELLQCQVQEREADCSRKRKHMDHDNEDDDSIKERINEITGRFEEICRDRAALQLRSEDGQRIIDRDAWPKSRPTSHLLDESLVFGRFDEKECILESVLSHSVGPGIVVLPIVGTGGIGKTTVAQMVYNDGRVRDHFGLMGWLHVSPAFDVHRLTVAITESLTKQFCGFSQLSLVHQVLKKVVDGKRLLLVLDDLWNERQSCWQDLLNPLKSAESVTILVTTRSKVVARLVQTVEPFTLGSLPKEDGWLLFQHYAFGKQQDNEQSCSVQIARRIFEKCGGLPLAAKSIGCLLRSKTGEDTWKEILESELWELDGDDDIFPPLRLSYYLLPTRLKPCFILCSLYPRDSGFTKDQIIHLWIAQGYINSTRCKIPEKVGATYFDELHARSLIETFPDQVSSDGQYVDEYAKLFVTPDQWSSDGQYVDKYAKLFVTPGQWSSTPYQWSSDEHHNYRVRERSSYKRSWNDGFFKMHDVIYELAKSLSNKGPRSMRTLLLHNDSVASIVKLSSLTYLRALVLESSRPGVVLPLSKNVNNMISCIGNLKHLRYLRLNCDAHDLPESIYRLYSLEKLVISTLRRVCSSSFNNLVSLRYLHISFELMDELLDPFSGLDVLDTLCLKHCSNIVELPLSVGNLMNLQCLQLIGISSFGKLDHNYFRCHNNNTQQMKLVFPTLEELVLEDLCKMEDWFGVQDSDCPKLHSIIIRNCCKLRRIPYFSSLRKVVISKLALTNLQLSVGDAPSHLQVLDIRDCPRLNILVGLQNLYSLWNFYIARCPRLYITPLEELPFNPSYSFIADCPKLERWCNNQELNYFQVSKKMKLSDPRLITEYGVANFLSVQHLSIEKCHELSTELLCSTNKWLPCNLHFLQFSFCNFSGALGFHDGLTMLSRLEIRSCTKLESLIGLHKLLVLHTLFIADCSSLDFFIESKFPPRLSSLAVHRCHKLRSLHLVMDHPSMLMELEISDCQGLMHIGNLNDFSNLESLKLVQCHLLQLQELCPAVPESAVIFRCPRLKKWCEIHGIEPQGNLADSSHCLVDC